MHVLVGVNGSEIAAQAAGFVARLLAPDRDRITLYCSPPPIQIPGKERLSPAVPQNLLESFSEGVFDLVRKEVPPALHPVMLTRTGTGPADQGLLSTAAEISADMIVVGADSGASNWMVYLGGVARSVAKRSQVPVLVYRPRKRLTQDPGVRVLFADDGSPGASHAGEFLQRFHWPEGSTGLLARVLEWLDLGAFMPVSPGGEVAYSWQTEYAHSMGEARERVMKELLETQRKLPSLFRESLPLVLDGHRIRDICQTVMTHEIDLLVVGARNLAGVERLLGSTSAGLLRYAACSILIVREARGG